MKKKCDGTAGGGSYRETVAYIPRFISKASIGWKYKDLHHFTHNHHTINIY